jgi:hypothetical protein
MPAIEETDEYQNWTVACADVDFLADEHRPELTAAIVIMEKAQLALMRKMEETQEYQEWLYAFNAVDFTAAEHYPELLPKITRLMQAQDALQIKIDQMKGQINE